MITKFPVWTTAVYTTEELDVVYYAIHRPFAGKVEIIYENVLMEKIKNIFYISLENQFLANKNWTFTIQGFNQNTLINKYSGSIDELLESEFLSLLS